VTRSHSTPNIDPTGGQPLTDREEGCILWTIGIVLAACAAVLALRHLGVL
jgi:hypothetical protein